MKESNLMPETETVGASWRIATGALVNDGSVVNVTVPPLPGTTPPAQLAGSLQLPPKVPKSAAHVPLVCALARPTSPADSAAAVAAAMTTFRAGADERRDAELTRMSLSPFLRNRSTAHSCAAAMRAAAAV